MQRRKEILIVHLICIGLGSQRKKEKKKEEMSLYNKIGNKCRNPRSLCSLS